MLFEMFQEIAYKARPCAGGVSCGGGSLRLDAVSTHINKLLKSPNEVPPAFETSIRIHFQSCQQLLCCCIAAGARRRGALKPQQLFFSPSTCAPRPQLLQLRLGWGSAPTCAA